MTTKHNTHSKTGWIKCYRAIEEHWIFDDPVMLKVWIAILLKANHKKRKLPFGGIMLEVERGSFIVSKLTWAERLRITRTKLDRRLRTLESDQMIVQQTSNRSTLISVVNFCTYQHREAYHIATAVAADGAANEQQAGNEWGTVTHQTCTNKNDNNSKNAKNDEDVCVENPPHALDHHFVSAEKHATWMTNPQYAKAGRRPLKKYPEMFLTPAELAGVFEQLGDSGVPADQFKLVFMRVAARLMTYKAQGKNLETISVYNWLVGWAKSDVVKDLTDSCNLARSKVYLAGAKI